MTFFLFACAQLISIPFMLASPLPRETPFFIAVLALFMLPTRHCIVLAVAAGAAVDLFSPIKGLSAITYPIGILIVSQLSRSLLAYRSLFAYVLLAFCGGLVVLVLKGLITGGTELASGSDAGSYRGLIAHTTLLYLRAGLLNIFFIALLYCVFRLLRPPRLV